jgi:cation diffusion facilitator family transporter
VNPPGAEVDRQRAVRRVLWITLGLNLAVTAAKGIYGLSAGSLAITADALHSLVDASANVLGLVVLRFAAAPPDEGHPYGHRKMEVVAAAVLGGAIAMVAVRFAWGAVDALAGGREPPATSAAGFAVILGTWAVNLFVAWYESRRARALGSDYLAADAAHTASDVLVTAAVLASFTAAHYGVAWADPVGALAVIAALGWVAWRVLSLNLGILVDSAAVDADRVEAIAMGVEGVRGCHRIRSRGTRSAAHLDLHILLDNETSLRRAHAVAHRVEEALRRELPEIADVVVHMEPEESGHEEL